MEIINMDILFVLFKAPTESMSVFSSILRNTTLRHSTTTETTLFIWAWVVYRLKIAY